ncbi:AMP-binding protein [uncultured Fusobacterium sp.]|jgi:long-chain acyl-CoA synthetase|uniref:AMP-binding protein n=1 Tax=uncultured Fusobacterium sp. TaxID=159267 RepID=UPI0015A6912D|nr:AMP-binding protein [uncultured Fusobacterium sp.]
MRLLYDRNKAAIIYKDREYSYKELLTGIKYYSTLLNIKKDSKVVVYVENRPEIIQSFFSIWEKQGIAIVLDAGYTPEQLLYVFNDAEPEYIYVTNKNYKNAVAAKEMYGKSLEIINIDNIVVPKEFQPDNYELNVDNVEDTAVILYTSGTTGNPKGVMLSYKNLLSNVNAIKAINLVDETDRVLAILPYHHVFPLNINLLMTMYFGTLVVILDELSSEALRHALREYKISVIIGVPRVWEMLHKAIMNKINSSWITKKIFKICQSINSKALSRLVFKKVYNELGGSLRVMASGGAKLDPEVSRDYLTLGLPMIEGYGLTETSPIIAFNKPTNVKAGTVGEIIPDVEVKIAEDGEILVKGANVMKGYYNNPTATKEVIDENGFFHTGDLGKFDGDHLVIVGRKKEMIVLSNGKNINPADIENEIMKGTDLIKEIAVMEYNNHLMAVVYPDFDLIKHRNITNIKESLKWEIIDKYNVTAPKYRKILEVKIVKNELPKTKLGKVRRFMLNDFLKGEVVEDGAEGTVVNQQPKKKIEVPEELKEIYTTLKENIERNYDAQVTPDAHLELDLGLDSLDIVEILSFVESSYGVKIKEEEFTNIKNVLALAEFIKNHGGTFSSVEIDWKSILNERIDINLPKSAWVGKLIRIITMPIFSLYFSLKKESQDKISNEPAIYVGNHQSFLDALMFNQAIPMKMMNDTYYIATVVHFDTPLRRYLADRGNVLIVDINKNLKETLQVSAEVLREGKNLVIFPEGARTRDGELQEFKKTFAILSKELNVPVVPFGIKGAYKAMPYGSKFPSMYPIKIKFFDKICPENLTIEEIVEKSKEEIESWLMR